jgi:hypothetical protein
MTEAKEVPEPILHSPFEEPVEHRYIGEGEQPELRTRRQPGETARG